ncbi:MULTISPECIES: GAF domain-containing protein [unclassified Massilia]|uniref:GAF domain-containing protein n=1 Tax=unclassified Massilia TaxID=2609279 RepID=UPI00177C260C|nr:MULTISPECIES: GAF domain-containing protein [unclassified Massilia]MBD8529437.1 GAF domain-containing protein [Massilia sp. CFBP 13647]MBD8672830.1 GAF domain-containing protein [Massilia sp. CFBP 13721]
MNSNATEEDPILTTSAAARLLGVATSTVQLWMESGAIDSWKTPGGHRRTRESHIRALMTKVAGHHAPHERRQPATPTDPEFLPNPDPAFPVAEDEAQRLAALAATNLVDSLSEERFERIVRLASKVTESPIALISLLTARRQWFKARVGLPAQQTPREWAFCTHAILQDGPFVIEDAMSDARFSGNPLVLADPHMRFYAGVPLRDRAGMAMGTLCVIDREPRKLRATELQALVDLAAIAAGEIEASVKD